MNVIFCYTLIILWAQEQLLEVCPFFIPLEKINQDMVHKAFGALYNFSKAQFNRL